MRWSIPVQNVLNHKLKTILEAVFFFFACAVYSLEVPDLAGFACHDTAGILTRQQVEEIESFLQDLNEKSKVQLALLTITSLESEEIETYSIKVVETWKLGDKVANSGVLLLIAKNERKVRIEVGYGLESILTDAVSSLIIKNVIAPSFKKNDYYTGIKDGLRAISAYALQDESLIRSIENKAKKRENDKYPFSRITFIIIFLYIIAMFLGRRNIWPFVILTSLFGNGSAYRRYNKRSRGNTWADAGSFSAFGSSFNNSSSDDDSSSSFSGNGGRFGGGGATGGW